MRQQAEIIGIVMSYVALATLHLWLLSRLPLKRNLKAAAIIAMGATYFVAFRAAEDLPGWSAATAVPDRFKLIATRVVEPDHIRRRPGAIHLWVEELDDRNIPSGEPRAYLLPYSTDLAAKANTAQAEIGKGRALGGTSHMFARTFSAGAPQGANVRTVTQGVAPGGDPSGGGLLDPAALGGQSKSVDLIPLPPPLLPPKDDP